MFRKPRFIIAAAAMLYAVALLVAWRQGTVWAENRALTILRAAEEGYGAVILGEIEAALRNVSGALVNLLGSRCVSQTKEEMCAYAKLLNVDEVNIVDRRGLVIASNIDSVLGFDFNSNPLTREFMALTNSANSMVTQPFRNGVANPDMFCKYYAIAFPEHDGFVQLGMTVERLRQNMYSYSADEADRILKDWHFSVVGWYERAGGDPEFLHGRIVRRWNDGHGEYVIGRFFDWYGYRYVAYLPESFCYAQRNSTVAVTAAVMALIVVFFVFFLMRLASASLKLEKLHREAAARSAADLALAKTIQMSALPTVEGAFFDRLEFSLAAETHPAREVGGGFYDFYPLHGGRVALVIADVSGKGISGALFMMETKNIIKNALSEFADIGEAATVANRRICEHNQAELFLTAWIGVLDVKTGVVEYVNAGHNRPLLRRADGTVEKVMGKGGRFFGMFEEAQYRVNALALGKGDFLFLYTDGFTEAMNAKGEQFGEARLKAEVANRNRTLEAAVAEFVGGAEPSDDRTSLTLFWQGEPQRTERVFPCREDSLGEAVAFVRGALAGVAPKAVAAVLNAADEITANIVSYSGASFYRLAVERGDDRLRLRFSDDGRPYNPMSHVDPDTHAAIEDRPIGGLGLVMVKRLVDRVSYAREDGENVLTLLKKC